MHLRRIGFTRLLCAWATLAVLLVPARAGAAYLADVAGADGRVPVYVVRPAATGPVPVVVLLPGCDGIDGRLAVAADRLTALGDAGVVVDAVGASHPNGVCGPSTAGGEPAEVTAARAVLAWLHTQSWAAGDRLAVIGFSMGGDALLDLIDPAPGAPATPVGLRAAVAFYPGCADHAPAIRVPLAIFDGDADRIAPAAPCADLVRRATAAGAQARITTYPGATHGFDVPGPDRTFFGEPIHFDPAATGDAARATAAFLQERLEP